jgi:hypothetical protein
MLWAPERPWCRVGAVDGNVEGCPGAADIPCGRDGDVVWPILLAYARTARGVGDVDANGPEQVFGVCGTPVHIRVMPKIPRHLLNPLIRPLRPIPTFRPSDKTCWSPTTEATAMRELVVEKMEQGSVFLVLDNLAAPGRVAARVIIAWVGIVGMIVSSSARCGRKIEAPTVGTEPAWVAVASLGLGVAEAIETAIFVCEARLYKGKGCE